MRRAIALLSATVVLVVACSSAGASATPDPAAAFCPALDQYGASLIALDSLDATATVEEYRAAVVTARASLTALTGVAGAFAGAQLASLTTAQLQLEAAAADLNANSTPAQAEAALDSSLQAVIQEIAGTRNALCNTRPTPSTAP